MQVFGQEHSKLDSAAVTAANSWLRDLERCPLRRPSGYAIYDPSGVDYCDDRTETIVTADDAVVTEARPARTR